ncbi:MAG: hypothetical protein GY801_46680 [bacterium]|nr:hypothetical protein [bacterium]
MKAIILAAGAGRWMQPLTYHPHKTLLQIHKRAVIQWIIDALLEHRVTDAKRLTSFTDL